MTATQNYGNIIPSTPILSADSNVKEDVMTDQQKLRYSTAASAMRINWKASRIRYRINANF